MTNKQQLDYSVKWDLLKPLILHLYSAGSYVPEQKILRVQFSDSQVKFPKLMPLEFDARFFGPFSTSVETALEFGSRVGYITEGNHTRGNEPIHMSRRLGPEGVNHARILSDMYESFGLEDYQRFVARQLAISSMPTSAVVGLGLYYTGEEPSGINMQLKESDPAPYRIFSRVDKETVYSAIELVKKCNLLKDVHLEKESVDNEFVISYMLDAGNIHKRYDYLKFEEDTLKQISSNKKIDSGNVKGAILDRCCNDLDDEPKNFRSEHIAELIDKHSKVPKYYVEEYSDIVKTLEKKFSSIESEYNRIFDIMRNIATLSEWHPFKTTIKIGGNYTSSHLRVDEELKGKIRDSLKNTKGPKVWHFGMDLYIQHIPQFLDRIFLIHFGYPREKLENSLSIS